MVIQVMVVMATEVTVANSVTVIQDMVAMETHTVNNIAIVNLQQENLLTNSLPHPEKNLSMIIKTVMVNSRTQILIEELSFQMFNNHLPLLQLTLRECL